MPERAVAARLATELSMGPELPPPFVPYGPAHVGTIALTGLAGAGLVALVRRRPGAGAGVRRALFAAIALVLAFELTIGASEGWLTWRTFLPLHLCDAAMILALLTLLWPRPWAAELLYFWAAAGSTLAMLTPDLPWGFPRWEFFVFFGLHGLVLIAAAVLVFGLDLRPRRGAPRRAFVATLALAAVAGTVDALLGTNFMFLRSRPLATTPLDWMGPWPVYIAVAAVVALVVFHLLALPFRREWRQAGGA
ncbi:MAG: TIGR02206 family membrane protein [Acidobacteriota bacterium]|jgi:hypothetical integral membrane protein (TIGR02206 family)